MSSKLIDFNALSSYKTQSDLKYQDKLTAGTGISIDANNVISATGGGGGGEWTLYTSGVGGKHFTLPSNFWSSNKEILLCGWVGGNSTTYAGMFSTIIPSYLCINLPTSSLPMYIPTTATMSSNSFKSYAYFYIEKTPRIYFDVYNADYQTSVVRSNSKLFIFTK